MAITRWDPFTEMNRFRSVVDNMFNEAFRRGYWGSGDGDTMHALPLDVYETPTELVVKAHVPGASQNDVRITMERGVLTIQAHLPSDMEKEEARNWRWHSREVWHGDVSRTLTLPNGYDADKVQASFKNGVLTLAFPKSEAARPREIPISVSE